MDKTVAIHQPTGHAHQIPIEEFVQAENRNARTTRSIRSVNVAAINWRIALIPRRTPSAASFAEITK